MIVANFCLECWNKLNGTNDSERKYIMSDGLSLCEECGEMKQVIEGYKSACFLYRFRYVMYFFTAFFKILFLPVVVIVYAVRRTGNRLRKKQKILGKAENQP